MSCLGAFKVAETIDEERIWTRLEEGQLRICPRDRDLYFFAEAIAAHESVKNFL
jgi:hypothetical protein